MALGITGQRGKNSPNLVLEKLSTFVPMEKLTDPTAIINRRELSGKTEGSAVLTKDEQGSFCVYVATGDKPESPWKSISAVPSWLDMPVEYVDMVDIAVHQSSSSDLTRLPGARTVLIQYPMWDLAEEVLYRNCLTASARFNIETEGSVGIRKPYTFKLNGVLANEGQYYVLDALLCAIQTDTTTNGLPLVMPHYKGSRTNEFTITVDTMLAEAKQFELNFYLEWTSPTRFT